MRNVMKNNAPQTNPYGYPREAQTPRNREDFKREHLRTEDPDENQGFGGGFTRPADTGVGKKKKPRNTILTFFRRLLLGIATRLRDWNEFWGIPVALLAFLGFPFLLRLVDSTVGSYDLSVLQSLLLGVLAFWFVKGVAWWLLRLDFPEVYRWLDDQLETLFAQNKTNAQTNAQSGNHDSKEEERHSWQKARLRTVVSLSLYALYLLLLVVMVVVAL